MKKYTPCYSDTFDDYDRLWIYCGVHEVFQGKTGAYSVEADNAELRFTQPTPINMDKPSVYPILTKEIHE
jgi:hypothetical protein